MVRKDQIEEVTHWPPNSCMPRSAKTTMKRKRRNSRLMIDFIELRRDTTRFLKEFQYLKYMNIYTNVPASSMSHTGRQF